MIQYVLRKKTLALAAVNAVALTFVGYVLFGLLTIPEFTAPPIGGPFTLTDHTGKSRTDRDFHGDYLLVYFGYTSCPDVCPTELLEISQALDLLAETAPEKATAVTPLFITVDPERDTVGVLQAYVSYFHDRLVGLTGGADAIQSAARHYHVSYNKVPGETPQDYLMDHVSYIFLMGPDGAYLTHFNAQAGAERMASELARRIGKAAAS